MVTTQDHLSSEAARRGRSSERSPLRTLSKVPQVTVFFWIIKVLCTTVGETASDFLNINLGFGLKGTAIAAGIALALALLFQFRARGYVPAIYWLAVVLISVFGTLVTDILTDSLGFPLEGSAVIFSVALGLTFAVWYAKEGTLSIHSIVTPRREAFYWSAILFTFALGTASGDLMAEALGLGYLVTGLIVLAVIGASVIAWRVGLDAVLAFWIAYVLTRPLGASLGDYLSQSHANGGLGLGAKVTSVGFLLAILAVVGFLALTQRDRLAGRTQEAPPHQSARSVALQAIVAVGLLLAASGTGYALRRSQLQRQAAQAVSPAAPLGDLAPFKTITADLIRVVRAGDKAGANARADDLETAWDNAQARMRPMNPEKWTLMDSAIDEVLAKVRSGKETAESEVALDALTKTMKSLGEGEALSATQTPSPPPQSRGATPDDKPRALGDLSSFKAIAQDILTLVRKGDSARARSRARDLEAAWDKDQSRLQPRNPQGWTLVDEAIDDVLKKVRAAQPSGVKTEVSLRALFAAIEAVDDRQ